MTKNIIPDPIELPTEYVSSISSLTGNHKEGNNYYFEQYLRVSHYPETKATLINVLKEYREAVAFPGDHFGVTTYAEHNIKLKLNTNLIYINAYKLPHSHRETVQKMVTEMLEQGVIQESHSPWKSPLFLVPKNDGTFRPVIDFWRVNEVTEDDRYPLPVLRDFLMCLGRGNKVFTSLDLVSGYWQLPMAPESRDITDFSTPNGHYEWTLMPFGLKGAPLIFQRTMNHLFWRSNGKGSTVNSQLIRV